MCEKVGKRAVLKLERVCDQCAIRGISDEDRAGIYKREVWKG